MATLLHRTLLAVKVIIFILTEKRPANIKLTIANRCSLTKRTKQMVNSDKNTQLYCHFKYYCERTRRDGARGGLKAGAVRAAPLLAHIFFQKAVFSCNICDK